METAIIIVLAFMLLILFIILLDINFDNKENQKLQTKYQSALNEIFETNERIKSINYQINKYDKCNKQIAEQLIKKDKVIKDAFIVIRELENDKHEAIIKANQAVNLCNEMANKFEFLNSELKSIESQLLGKL